MQTGPNEFDTFYETRDFDCPELEAFISWGQPNKPFARGFVGLEILPREDGA
jgi:hypothetical protein